MYFCLYPNFQDFLIFFVFMKKALFQETFIVATGNTMLLMLMTLWIKVQMCNRIKQGLGFRNWRFQKLFCTKIKNTFKISFVISLFSFPVIYQDLFWLQSKGISNLGGCKHCFFASRKNWKFERFVCFDREASVVSLIPCPSMGPKWFWIDPRYFVLIPMVLDLVLVGSKL